MIDLQLLGGLTIDRQTRAIGPTVTHRHPLALLALVAAAAPQPIAREKVMALLWPESDSARASNSLRQVLFRIPRELSEEVFLPESTAGLQLDQSRLRVDLWAFREALERDALEAAVRVYRGPFLDGFGIPRASELARWVESERDRLARQHLNALDALATRAGAEGRLEELVAWRRRQAAADPFSSRVALALLEALVAAGDRPGALEHASVYENTLRLHLEIEPDLAVTEFAASLRRDRRDDGARRAPERDHSPREPAEPQPASVAPPDRAQIAKQPGGRALARRLWPVAAGVAVIAVGVGLAWLEGGASGEVTLDSNPVIVLTSGATPGAGRDRGNRLIACSGPACPAGGLPQDAYAVAALDSFAMPMAGSGFIAPVPEEPGRTGTGYACCTTATFENEFSLPPEAVTARISLSLSAEEAAVVTINDVQLGRPARQEGRSSSERPAENLTASFKPGPDGKNRLRVTLSDSGGAPGLYYHALVEYGTRPNHAAECAPNVREADRYTLVYALSIPEDANYEAGLPPYSVDHSEGLGPFDRVAYCLQLDDEWVWVSMDAFSRVPAHLGVPVSATGATFQQPVANMNVYSNVPGVVTGRGIATGSIEFWHQCYDESSSRGLPGASNTLNDFDDTFPHALYGNDSCYGSMQVHNHGEGQTVFAYNQWDRDAEFNSGPDDLGIGSSPVGMHPDWTFESNADRYRARTLYVLARRTSAGRAR